MSLDFVAKIGGFIRQGCWLGQVDGLFFSPFFSGDFLPKNHKKRILGHGLRLIIYIHLHAGAILDLSIMINRMLELI
jgi:hypothetical protein